MDERRGSYSKNKPVDTSARSIALKDILEVRAGTENDPASFDAFDSTSSAVGVPPVKSKSLFSRNTSEASMTDPSLSRHTSNNDVLSQDQNNVAAKRVSLKKRRSSFFSRSDDTNEAARGTAVLRRNCKAGDLELSFSLILPNRYVYQQT